MERITEKQNVRTPARPPNAAALSAAEDALPKSRS
jgi:hypothetical protein